MVFFGPLSWSVRFSALRRGGFSEMETSQGQQELTDREHAAFERLALVEQLRSDISQFTPRCIVCTQPVPRRRATSRSKETCSPECAGVLRAFKKFNILARRCPTCWHPSTPAEREEFKAWRRSTGKLRDRAGKPSRKVGELTAENQRMRKALETINRFRNRQNAMTDLFYIVIEQTKDRQICIADLIDAALGDGAPVTISTPGPTPEPQA